MDEKVFALVRSPQEDNSQNDQKESEIEQEDEVKDIQPIKIEFILQKKMNYQ